MMIMMILSNSISDYPIVGIGICVCLVLVKRIVQEYFAITYFGRYRNYTLVVTMLANILLKLVIVVVITYFDNLTSFYLKIIHLVESMLFSF